AVVTVFTVFAASLKASLQDTIDRSFRGDLMVTSGGFGRGAISPELAGQVAALPQVDTAVGMGQGALLIDGSTKEVAVSDPVPLGKAMRLDVTGGSLGDV